MGFAETFFDVVGAAKKSAQDAVAPFDFATVVRPWLVMQYQVTRGTIPVLEYAIHVLHACGSQYEPRLRDDLIAYYTRKMDDESNHDRMLLEDIEAAGIEGAELAPPNPFVAEMIGRQYYLIDFESPAAYLGFIGLLEGFPPTLEQVSELQAASALPPEAFRTIRLHAQVDVKHREELAVVLDSVPEKHHPAIVGNALRCVALHAGALAHATQEKPWTP